MKALFRKFSYLHLVQHEPGHPRITPLRPGLFTSRCAHSASTGVPRVVEALEARCGIFTKASCAWMRIGVAKGDDGWASTWIVQRIGVIRLTSKRGREGLALVHAASHFGVLPSTRSAMSGGLTTPSERWPSDSVSRSQPTSSCRPPPCQFHLLSASATCSMLSSVWLLSHGRGVRQHPQPQRSARPISALF